MKTWRELVTDAKQGIGLLQPKEVWDKIEKQNNILVIDVREPDEVQKGRLPQSIPIPRGVIESTVEQNFKDRSKQIILYCAGGGRSAVAAQSLKAMGYENVASMEGGFGGWVRLNLPIV